MMKPQPEFTVLYDGACPICQKEVAWLCWKNTRGKLSLRDIRAQGFDPARYGKSMPELLAEIHGVHPDGSMIKGMPVFRASYRAVGLGWLLAPTGWPLLRPLFDGLYRLFARHRSKLGGMLTGVTCRDAACNIQKKTS